VNGESTAGSERNATKGASERSASSPESAASVNRPRMAVGTWAWVFGPYAQHPVPLAGVLRDVRAIGYDGVELTGRPHAHPDDLPTPDARRGLARLVADHGLAIASLGGPVGGGSPLVVKRGAYLDSFRTYVELCADAGITALRLASGRPAAPVGAAAGIARLVDYWGAAAELAAGANLRLLWEFEPHLFASRPQDVVAVTDGIGRPNFQVMFDLSHAYVVSVGGKATPEPAAPLERGLVGFVRLLGRRIGRLHLADTDGETEPNGGSKRRRLGQGSVDLDAALVALREAGEGQIGDGWWTLDLHGEPDATAVARESKDVMDRLAARHSGAA
jgi:sugar phosphate isomerase/epimerase